MRLFFLIIVFFSHQSFSQDRRVPAFYSVGLEPDHELYKFALEGPCERSIDLRSNNLPIDVKNINLGEVIELSENGEFIRQWATPTGSHPVTVSGDILQLYFFNLSNEHIFVSLDGKITPAFEKPADELLRSKCPYVEAKPYISEHLICGTLIDKKSREKRLFAWAPVCS